MTRVCGYIIVLLLISQAFLISSEDLEDDHWVVETSTGPVEGFVITPLAENQAYVFYGVPYAEPPVGELRFNPPQPVKPWKDVIKCNKKPLPCYQHLDRASMFRVKYEDTRVKRPWSEDCLTLNIWVPKPKVENAPVLVSLHAGVFEFGSNNDPDGSILAAKAGNLVVSMNYRLGPFGFLNLGVPDVPGNMGLLDQQLALKWIHDNVHHFGGLAKAIILVGAGNAGSASAGYHFLAPGSADYFATAAVYSGAPTCSWAYQERETSIHNSKVFSERLGCSNEANEDSLACLRKAHPEDIVDAYKFPHSGPAFRLMPTVDGTFMTESPLEALINGHFKKSSFLSCSTRNDGSLMVSTLNFDLMPKPEEGMSREHFRTAVTRISPGLSRSSLTAIEEIYLDDCKELRLQEIRDAAIRVYSDVLVDCCTNQFLDLFIQNGGAGFRAVFDVYKSSVPAWVGSHHAVSVQYGFGYPLVDGTYSKVDYELTSWLMTWVNDHTRRKIGDIATDLVAYDAKKKNFTMWTFEGPKYNSHYRENECRLWDEVIPKLQESKPCGNV